MTSREFCVWLEGYLARGNELSAEQVDAVRKKLASVRDAELPVTPTPVIVPIIPYEPPRHWWLEPICQPGTTTNKPAWPEPPFTICGTHSQ